MPEADFDVKLSRTAVVKLRRTSVIKITRRKSVHNRPIIYLMERFLVPKYTKYTTYKFSRAHAVNCIGGTTNELSL
jgi:hypothetical protein